MARLNPKTTEYEFFGPPGAAIMMIFLPAVVYYLYFACPSTPHCGDVDGNCSHCSVLSFPVVPTIDSLFDTTAFLVCLGWLAFQIAIELILPGKIIDGLPLRTGEKLSYKMNVAHLPDLVAFASPMSLIAPGTVCSTLTIGLLCFTVSVGGAFALHLSGYIDLAYLYHNFLTMATASIVISTALSFYLYFSSFAEGALLALGGNTGNAIYDFFIGRELNPRIGSLDLKVHFELRPGLIGWTLITWGMAAEQYNREGIVSNAMLLVCFFQLIYVFDSFNSEPCILSIMDITHDGFGFMLAFGDLAWVPFTYSLQARYLVDHPQDLSHLHVLTILAINVLGYCIFRGANSIKDKFRKDPNHPSVAHIKYIPTKTGSKLMCSGWWGMARHINYLGDLFLGLSWCLPCGFDSVLPYFYFFYFAALLIHRERRDDHKCHTKYGKDWEKYCAMVPWRIVPYVY